MYVRLVILYDKTVGSLHTKLSKTVVIRHNTYTSILLIKLTNLHRYLILISITNDFIYFTVMLCYLYLKIGECFSTYFIYTVNHNYC